MVDNIFIGAYYLMIALMIIIAVFGSAYVIWMLHRIIKEEFGDVSKEEQEEK